mmetsp:Transcript_12834/g.26311  ORF Transcript_12834/g.26311 Transcript_12834/m.26311 type:complete len:84 (+) Transcript_12834:198-449(+)
MGMVMTSLANAIVESIPSVIESLSSNSGFNTHGKERAVGTSITSTFSQSSPPLTLSSLCSIVDDRSTASNERESLALTIAAAS